MFYVVIIVTTGKDKLLFERQETSLILRPCPKTDVYWKKEIVV